MGQIMMSKQGVVQPRRRVTSIVKSREMSDEIMVELIIGMGPDNSIHHRLNNRFIRGISFLL
jgi:hypothetical protein